MPPYVQTSTCPRYLPPPSKFSIFDLYSLLHWKRAVGALLTIVVHVLWPPPAPAIRSNPSPLQSLNRLKVLRWGSPLFIYLLLLLFFYMLCPLPVLSQPPPLLWICWDCWGQVRYYTDNDDMIVMSIVVVVILTPQTMTALIWSLVVYWAPLNLLRLLGSGTLLYW